MTQRADLARRRSALRTVIRDAAIAEFAANGLRGTSTQAIADRAGITKTKLHYHISSKDELYLEALDHILQIWADLFTGIDLDQSPQAVLTEYIGRKIKFSIEEPEKVKFFTNEVMHGADQMDDRWPGLRDQAVKAAETFQRWIDEGLIRPVDPMMLQFHLWALTENLAVMAPQIRVMQGLDAGEALDAERFIDEIAAFVLRGILPPEPPG